MNFVLNLPPSGFLDNYIHIYHQQDFPKLCTKATSRESLKNKLYLKLFASPSTKNKVDSKMSITQQTFVLMKRRLNYVLKKSSVFIFRRRFQDVLVKTNILLLVIRLQNVFKTSWKNIFKTSSRRLQEVFKTSSRLFQNVFKTFSRRLAKISSRRFQDVSSS